MRAEDRITWLLLALSCLVQQVRPDDVAPSDTPGVTVTKDSTGDVNTPGTPVANAPEATPSINPKQPTEAVTALPTPEMKTETEPAPTPAPETNAEPTKPTSTVKPTTAAPVPVTEKPSTPSSGGNTAVADITTVSKPAEKPTTAGPGGSGGGSPVGGTTAPLPTPTTKAPQPSASQAPSGTLPVTMPKNTGNIGTTKETTATTTVPHLTVGATTLQNNEKEAEKTTVVITSKPIPDQVASGSTVAPEKPKITPGLPTVTTERQATPDVVPESTPGATKPTGTTGTTVPPTTSITTTTAAPQPRVFSYSLNNGQQNEEEKDLVTLCKQLMGNLQDGNCTLLYRHHNGKLHFDSVEINGKVKATLVSQHFEEITKKPTDNKTLIAILASCGALLIMIVILAVCASHHRKPYNENQQHLTEELHTVENGYHDNPTLEVMEVQPEMQEKKLALNGEFNDSWIVPIDNLLKEDVPDEEDTHL